MIQNVTSLDWERRIHDLRSDFKLESEYATAHTTIEDALSHRSGLAGHPWAYRPGNSDALVQSLQYLPLTSEPRVRFQYCNLMYGVVANLITHLTRMPLDHLLKHYLWYPLGMASTFFSLSEAIEAVGDDNMSKGYWWVDCDDDTFGPNPSCNPGDKGYYVPELYTNLTGVSGAGAIISSVNDYALWMRGILQSGLTERWLNKTSPLVDIIHSIVRPRSIIPVDLLAPITKELVTPPNYALGWFNSIYHGRVMMSHSGGVPGYVTEVFVLPEEGLGIVTLANAVGEGIIAGQLVVSRILQQKLNLSQAETEQDILQVRETGSLFRLEELHTGLLQPHSSSKSQRPSQKAHLPWKPRYRSQMENDPYFCHNSFPRDQYYHPAYGTFTITEHVLSTIRSHCRLDPKKQQQTLKEPAHTAFNDCPESCREEERFFIVEPSPHILNYAIYLQPKPKDANGGTRFDGMLILLHGDCADHFRDPPPTRSDAKFMLIDECAGSGIWQTDIAYLEADDDNYTERMGFVLEPEMVRHAERKARGERSALHSSKMEDVAEELRKLNERVLKNGMVWFDRIEDRRYAHNNSFMSTRGTSKSLTRLRCRIFCTDHCDRR